MFDKMLINQILLQIREAAQRIITRISKINSPEEN